MNGALATAGGLGLALGGGQISTLFLVLMRTSGLVVAAPILGHSKVPVAVKAGIIAVLTVAVAPQVSVATTPLPIILAAPIELLVGLALGFIVSLCFEALELAGRLLSLQLGLSLSAVFSPLTSESGTALDPVFSVFAGLLFLAMNLHLATVRVLAGSFTMLPLGGDWPTDLFLLVARMTALALEIGIRIAMPLALVLLLAELAVALLARAIPQINVFILGMPLKILVGLALLAIALPAMGTGASELYRTVFDGATRGVVP